MGSSLSDIAPRVVEQVPVKIQSSRTVEEGLVNQNWADDIQGGLSLVGLYEFFQLWDYIAEVMLSQEEDIHVWKLDASGQYSTKSAYRAFYNGSTTFAPWRRLWKSWAPPKCKIFLWLAIRNRCWTTDRLARRGLPHPEHCPLCDQEEETVQHLLTSCVLAREFWSCIFSKLNLQEKVPTVHEESFVSWWRRAIKRVPKERKEGLNTVIILGAWVLWKHRNDCVFNSATPRIRTLLKNFDDEHHLWCMAGAGGLRRLALGLVSEPN
ncbi:hypothetical protein PR202_ga08120 [Eleusine coracana subsp. coracana]|uniref:Reverse transcriptase zinc-binding domain-containing protein n=1 Tax=Eleusine coracana subsp. coracana TaxID=191504 RepID=A0AAV5C1D9_ELECO|nr:hypothetical protein PR202_ga08120 [Eleusine coracana subsp. coracana]